MRLSQIFVCLVLCVAASSVRAGVAYVHRSDGGLEISLAGDVEQGVTSVTYDGVVVFDDPTAQRLGLDEPLTIPISDVNEFLPIEISDGSNDLTVSPNCCVLVEWLPASQLLIDGESLDPPSGVFPGGLPVIRHINPGQQLSIQSFSEADFGVDGPVTFYHSLYRVEEGVNTYLQGVDVEIATPGTATVDIAVLDAPGEYLLTSNAGGAFFDLGENIIVVPEPGGPGLILGLMICVLPAIRGRASSRNAWRDGRS